jgi:hypothetical protein
MILPIIRMEKLPILALPAIILRPAGKLRTNPSKGTLRYQIADTGAIVRVTWNLNDEASAKLRQFAKERKITLSEVADYLLVEGFRTMGVIIPRRPRDINNNSSPMPRSKTAPRA